MPKQRWVSLEGLRVQYREWGGPGDSVILVHGLASTCRIWDLVAPVLSRRFAVLALDLRGHGASDKPDSGYDFATVAEDLHRFVNALGLDRPIVIGHSWGADVALTYASSHPSELGGLAMVDGGLLDLSSVEGMTLDRARVEMAPPDFGDITAAQLFEGVRARDFGYTVTPQILDIMSAGFEELEDGTVRARFARTNHMAVIDAYWAHQPSQLFERVECPVLLMPVRGRGDDVWESRGFRREEMVARASQGLSRSKTVWLEDSVHDVPLQRPGLVASMIERHTHDWLI